MGEDNFADVTYAYEGHWITTLITVKTGQYTLCISMY